MDMVVRQALAPSKSSQLPMKGGELPILGDIQGDMR